MALISKEQILEARCRVGEIADENGDQIELVVVGGAAMVLGYNARLATKDVDALILSPADLTALRRWISVVADELELPDDWLNDAAKGYLHGISAGPVLVAQPGIRVTQPLPEQLLAMKLTAWRDDVDFSDAEALLMAIGLKAGREAVWSSLRPFVLPGRELKAHYAFSDLWERCDDSG